MNLARDEDDITFYHTSLKISKEIIPEISKENIIVLHRDFDSPIVEFTGTLQNRKEFKNFLRSNELPIVANCTEKSLKSLRSGEFLRAGIMLFRNITAENTQNLDTEFRNFAQNKRSPSYSFIKADMKDEICKGYAENIGIENNDLPILQIVQFKEGEFHRFQFNGTFNVGEMEKFLEDWKEGKLDRIFKSEKIPIDNPGPVYKVVGNSFKKEVIEANIHVLVKFYAPWCGHCKKLAPIYEKLAAKMNNTIKFVEIDMTKNDAPKQKIDKFPTLKLFVHPFKSEPVTYEGKHTFEEIEKFLLKQISQIQKQVKPDL